MKIDHDDCQTSFQVENSISKMLEIADLDLS